MINLVICFPIASIQEINQRGQQDVTTLSQWFQDFQVSLHPPLLLLVQVGQLTCTKQPGGSHAGCVAAKQTGTGKARHVDSGLGNELIVFPHHLVGQLGMDGVHKRFTNVSIHQIFKLLQLFHHTMLDFPIVTYLPECVVESGILFQLFRWPHLPLAFKGAGAILFTEDTVAEESDTGVFSKRISQVRYFYVDNLSVLLRSCVQDCI